MNNSTIRIGVLGELGVGKSELVHRICHPADIAPAMVSGVAGPTVDVCEYERPNGNESVWIEFLIIPSETRHPRSRQMLYSIGLDALFIVCNCALPKTFLRAAEWLEEAKEAVRPLNIPVALILGGPVAMDWTENTGIVAMVEPLSNVYQAKVLDLSGYTSAPSLSVKQRCLLSDFYEEITHRKFDSSTDN
ncbi:Rab-like protein 3 [Coemansia sp. RSA 2607]|nr:Rab-like protein 3 [Coemansia sp. RSA 2607]